MKIQIIPRGSKISGQGIQTAYLMIDHWNDFEYVTMFYLSVHDNDGKFHNIGNVKIGFKGQDKSQSTYETLDSEFDALPENYFSLGQDVEYYKNIKNLSRDFSDELLGLLNDIVFNSSHINVAKNEEVFRTALLRDVSLSAITGQYRRVINGLPPLTNFRFSYCRPAAEKMGGIKLDFIVQASSKPSTNIHAVIGRNGVGKTTLLNGMIEAITNNEQSPGKFFNTKLFNEEPISKDYFSSLVSVSFSAFDPFDPPKEQSDPSKGTCYFYIGLKNVAEKKLHALKTLPDLHLEFVDSLKYCLSQTNRKRRWENAIRTLESDENFCEMQLLTLSDVTGVELEDKAISLIEQMSSGHTIVLLIITKLVSRIEEKTLVLIDEPESHLHPPLLSAFIRSLSELLHDRNGVAIIATHSPVVLQEIPQTCVWKVNRSRLDISCKRPDEETFGENVGTLTREVFGLEVVKSGYHHLLTESVKSGESYEALLDDYGNQLGFEARAILKALVLHRDMEHKN